MRQSSEIFSSIQTFKIFLKLFILLLLAKTVEAAAANSFVFTALKDLTCQELCAIDPKSPNWVPNESTAANVIRQGEGIAYSANLNMFMSEGVSRNDFKTTFTGTSGTECVCLPKPQ